MRLIFNGNGLFDVTLALCSRAWWQKHAVIIGLVAAMFVSIFSVVIVKNSYCQRFIDYQAMQAHHDQITHQYDKLLLERGAFGSQLRVMQAAQNNLGMVIPDSTHIQVVSD